jgi:anti-sigma-K factor RskA
VNEHHQFEEEIALYGLGVLDGADKAELEGHLYACSACRDKLAASRGTLALLAFAAPAVKPSPIVRERILEAFKARGGGPIRSAPPAPERRGLRMAAWVLVWAAVGFLLVAAATWLAVDNRRLSRRLSDLELAHSQLEAASRELEAVNARARAALEILTAPQTVQVDLSPAAVHPEPHGKVFYNPGKGLLFYATHLRSLSPGQTYELWLIPAQGAPVDAGIFNTDSIGNGQVILPPLPSGLTAKVFAVTIEPRGGVPAPTGPKVLIGSVS